MKKGGGFEIVKGMISMETALCDLGKAEEVVSKSTRDWGCPHEFVPLEHSHGRIAPFIPNGALLEVFLLQTYLSGTKEEIEAIIQAGIGITEKLIRYNQLEL